MAPIESPRLRSRPLTPDDAAFMLRLLNEPSFHQNIGDRGVRTLDQTRAYLDRTAPAGTARKGLGVYLVERSSDGAAIGVCTLLKRDALDNIDLGYALVPEYWGLGYAEEASRAMLAFARERMGLQRLAAIVLPGNATSIRLLDRLGFRFERRIRIAEGSEETCLYGMSLDQ